MACAWNYLDLAFIKKLFLLGIEFYFGSFSSCVLKTLLKCFPASSLVRHLLPFLALFFCTRCVYFPLVTFKIFSLLLVLNNLIMMCLDGVFVMFFGLWICWNSWICGFIVIIKFGKFETIISLNIFLNSSCADSSYMCVKLFEVISQLTDILFIKNGFFPPCFILSSSYCYVFEWTNLFFFPANLSLISWSVLFISHIVVFISKMLIWIFHVSI